MSFRSLLAAGCAALLLVAAQPDVLHSQRRSRNKARSSRNLQEPPKEKLKASGAVKAVGRGVLDVVTDEGARWRLFVVAKPRDISVTGTADDTWLRPGMFVRFTAKFNKRGQALSQIEQLTVFTPREGFAVGVFPATELGEQLKLPTDEVSEKDENDNKKDGQNKEVGEELSNGKDEKKGAKPITAQLQIAGRLASVRKNWLRVVAGSAVVNAELATNAHISFDIVDYSYARPGDAVDLDAWYYRPQKGQGVAFATRLAISAAQPLTRRGRAELKPADDGQADAKEKPADTSSTP